MARDTGKSAEWLQISILAGFFTAGGFAVVTIALVFFLNPGKASETVTEARAYEEIKKLLSQEDMKLLRQEDRRLKEDKGSEKDLRTIISDAMTAEQLTFSSFPSATSKPPQGGVVEVEQKLVLKPAPLSPILQFIAKVKEAKKSIEVANLTIKNEKRKGQEGEDTWQATVDFVDYE
jgi:hypothetical protein